MRCLLTFVLAASSCWCVAQESPFAKFGKITPEHLQTKAYPIDSSAAAVVLSDIGHASIEGNSNGWFSVVTTRHKVVHVLKKPAYDEATAEVLLYTDGTDPEKLVELKAVTYNLEGGKVVETPLEKSSVFTEKRDKNLIVKKFTLPAVKEGSIIEYRYKVTSPYLSNVDPWCFQGSIPVLWSEFIFSAPQFYTYGFVSHGYVKAFVTERKDRTGRFTVTESRTAGPTENYNFTAGVADHRWVMKDVPELKPESYTSTLKNHIACIEFQLTSQNLPLTPKDYRASWTGLAKELMEADYFAGGIQGNNNWLSDAVKAVVAGAGTETEKARKIYQHVRDRFTCTRFSGLHVEQSPKATFKSGKGSAAEINLLLTAMLRNAGLSADPVILSKTSNGYAYDLYPMLSRFNYAVTQVLADGKTLYLDAAHSRLGFGKLLPECYNGHARVVNAEATPLYLMADSLQDRKVTVLLLNRGSKGLWEGHMNQTPGYFESYALRNRIATDGRNVFFKDVQRDFGTDIEVSDPHVDSLTDYDEPLGIRYAVSFNPPQEDVLYVNPMFGEGYKKNPFVSLERLYPVEMPCASDETYVLSLEVPEGYAVDELPRQIMVKFDPEGKSYFEYRVQSSGGVVLLRSRVKLARALFQPEEYDSLREFFNLIVKKHNEQIVFKKKTAAPKEPEKSVGPGNGQRPHETPPSSRRQPFALHQN